VRHLTAGSLRPPAGVARGSGSHNRTLCFLRRAGSAPPLMPRDAAPEREERPTPCHRRTGERRLNDAARHRRRRHCARCVLSRCWAVLWRLSVAVRYSPPAPASLRPGRGWPHPTHGLGASLPPSRGRSPLSFGATAPCPPRRGVAGPARAPAPPTPGLLASTAPAGGR
jgi:hypothetical protein